MDSTKQAAIILDTIDPEGKDEEVLEIRWLMTHRDYSIPNYSKIESDRTKGKKKKIICDDAKLFTLDAFHMRDVINRLKKKIEKSGSKMSFWAVHDAFGTHACDIDAMRRVVIQSFFEMHKERNLNDWTSEMRWVGKRGTSKQVEIGSLWEREDAKPDYQSYIIS